MDLAGELKRISDFGCHVLIQSDENYPALLREIYDPPLVLYVKGELTAKDKNAVAMVGSRMTTHYGIETARKLAYQLAYVGVTVVSGGARGIDTAAHQGALSRQRPDGCGAGNGHQFGFRRRRTRSCSSASRQTARSSRNFPSTARRTSNPFPSATASSPA